MEDAHVAELNLDEGPESSTAFFGVYDGHGGWITAQFAAKNLHKRLVTEDAYGQKEYELALKRAFLGTDEDLLASNLALSRGLGDFQFKGNKSLPPEKQILTADPDITCHEITDEDEFLVLACDGIWDCLSSQQVVDIVRQQVAQGKEIVQVCEMICDHCVAPDSSEAERGGFGCDNMSILIVAILNGCTKDEWYAWMKKRVEDKYGYDTSTSLPVLYSSAWLNARKERLARCAKREAEKREAEEREAKERPAQVELPSSEIDEGGDAEKGDGGDPSLEDGSD